MPRIERLRECKERLEKEAKERAAEQQRKIDERAAKEEAAGKRVRGRKPYEPNAIIKNDSEYILMFRKPGGYRHPTQEPRDLSVIDKAGHGEIVYDLNFTIGPGTSEWNVDLVNRKTSGGSRSDNGADAQGILTSVFRTARQQGRDPVRLPVKLLRSPRPMDLGLARGPLGRARLAPLPRGQPALAAA